MSFYTSPFCLLNFSLPFVFIACDTTGVPNDKPSFSPTRPTTSTYQEERNPSLFPHQIVTLTCDAIGVTDNKPHVS